MRDGFAFPRWLADRVPDDSRFADAYDSIAPERRALLKTCIARLWEWRGAERVSARQSIVDYRAGFTASDSVRPLDCAVIILDDSSPSPADLLAGLVPALAAGVLHVLALHVGSGWTDAQLTALELAGQEDVAELAVDEAAACLQEIAGHGDCVAVCIGGALTHAASRAGMKVWRSVPGPAVVVGEGFDLDALEFMHPGSLVQAATIQEINEKPAGVFTESPARAAFTAGHGMEACWAFTDMPIDLFLKRETRWTKGGLS
ncbi:hypothetical protein [Salidesulfovibrio brasiliensis]|uniref:hypothetical protein n=1 Tax=Salidesulfovibrio brasiliensis TaxID=221711 RepID=UPI0006D2073F|nr:hypothetical protein [Salidesulfovibrio brasiliensis]